MTILLTGATGHLGRDLLTQLCARHRSVRALARHRGARTDVQWAIGDLATGDGIRAALENVDTVIHAATLSPIAKRGSIHPIDLFRSPPYVDIGGTQLLLHECENVGIRHFLFVSIAGVDGGSLPYSKVKAAGEQLVRTSAVPWAVVRAAGFYYLLEQMLAGLKWLPVWPLPDAPLNPVATSDVAAYLIECLDDGKTGMREEIGGPETVSFAALARQYQRVAGFHRPIVSFGVSRQRAVKMGFAEAHGRRGRVNWSDWLSEHVSPRR